MKILSTSWEMEPESTQFGEERVLLLSAWYSVIRLIIFKMVCSIVLFYKANGKISSDGGVFTQQLVVLKTHIYTMENVFMAMVSWKYSFHSSTKSQLFSMLWEECSCVNNVSGAYLRL